MYIIITKIVIIVIENIKNISTVILFLNSFFLSLKFSREIYSVTPLLFSPAVISGISPSTLSGLVSLSPFSNINKSPRLNHFQFSDVQGNFLI